MPACRLSLRRIAALAMLILAAPCSQAQLGSQAQPTVTQVTPAPPVVVDGLGKGTAPLDGPWQFHPGDDPAWASPTFDSSNWEQITADRPWGTQGHAGLTGFAWYRMSLSLTPAPGVAPRFSLLIPQIDDAYEIYWNGSLIGRNGRLQPHPVWYHSQSAQIFALGPVQHGVLAVRVWKAPLLSDDPRESGGFETAPLIGSPAAIATARAALDFQWLRSRQFAFGEDLLCTLIALLSLLLWLRDRSRWVLFWTAGFALVLPATIFLLGAHMGWPYALAMGAAQPLSAIGDISLWFLLLWLLHLHGNRALTRLTRILACICLVNATLDGVLVAISWNRRWIAPVQTADLFSAFLYMVLEAFPLLLVSYALFQRKRFDSARWLVAILAFVDEMMVVVGNAIKQARLFHWAIALRIDSPLFIISGNAISLYTIAEALLLIAIVYAVYSSVREDQRRQEALEREKLELLHESQQMRHQAEHDGLTGLWNHRTIVERLREEMNRSRRNETPLCVVLIDVDHFKQINDNFGHLAGDLVLREIGAIFSRSLRPYDYAGRYGGEEFLLILPGCELETALSRAEQLRVAVQSARMMDGKTRLQVTASFGVASAFPSQEDAEAVIRAVDAALYRAKRKGRNCVIPAEMETPLLRKLDASF